MTPKDRPDPTGGEGVDNIASEASSALSLRWPVMSARVQNLLGTNFLYPVGGLML